MISLLTLFSPKVAFKDGQITPNTVTHPYKSIELSILTNQYYRLSSRGLQISINMGARVKKYVIFLLFTAKG